MFPIRLSATRKGQITIFLLVGMVLLIVFGSIFYFINLLKTQEFSDDVKDASLSQSLTQAQLQNTLVECLRQSSEDVVYTMGFQSGHIYRGQYGPDVTSNGILYEHGTQRFIVPFGITRGAAEPSPPQYPRTYGVDGFRYTLDILQQDFSEVHLWGKRQIPKLCEYGGENNPRTNSCDFATYGPTNTTIQHKIMVATQAQTVICLDREKERIKAFVGDIEINDTTVSLLITDSALKFTLTLNAKTILNGRETDLESVSHTLPVRLKRVYNLLFYLIEADITDVQFDKSRDYANITRCNYAQTIQCWDDEMKVSIVRNPQPGAHPGGDIILIEDQGSLIKGDSFYFATSVENRPPMLDYLSTITVEPDVDYEVPINGTLFLRPTAFDPDEDNLRMEYIGWKQRGFEKSPEYLIGTNCTGRPAWCGLFNATELLSDVKYLQPTVLDESNLSDYQPLKIRLGNKVDDDDVFCPVRPSSYQDTSCPVGVASCTCLQGNYCTTQEAKPITCQPGSICCQEISGSVTGGVETGANMICDGAKCYQSSKTVDLIQSCSGNNVSCQQYTVSSKAEQTCADGNCWQETKSGAAEQICTSGYCLQETDTGNLTTTCSAGGTQPSADQNGTLRICPV